MTIKSTSGFAVAIVAGLLIPAAGCHNGDGMFSRNRSAQYETISEGTANGVSSTIAAPGETAPPLAGSAPMTNTAVDTTTNLTIGTDIPMTTGTTSPTTSAYTPSYGGYSTPSYGTPARTPAPPAPTIHVRPSRQPDMPVQPTTTVPVQPTTTQVTPTTTVNTTTIDTTTAPAQQPDGHGKKDKKKDKKPQPGDDQTTDTAPPPPSTDTSDTTSAT